MKGSKALLLILLFSAGLLMLAVGFSGRLACLLAQHWQKQIATVPDDRAVAVLGRVADLGQPGIAVLVETLGSDRKSVARAAKRELLEELGGWEMLRAAESSPNLAILADALARRIDNFGPTARCDAADLATRILSWPLDPKVVDRGQVIASCERVLRSTRLDRRMSASRGRSDRRAMVETAPSGAGRRLLAETASLSETRIADMARLPGGGLPIETLPVPELSEDIPTEPSVVDVRSDESQLPSLPIMGSQVARVPEQHDYIAADFGSADSSSADSANIEEIETVELMRRLQAGVGPRSAGSRAELIRRGFSELQFDLARRLFDPDPQVRRQLARSLPSVRSVNPAPWLLLLCRDKDAEVRLLAITLLATTADPALLERVEQIARRDSDSRIQRQAKRIADRSRIH